MQHNKRRQQEVEYDNALRQARLVYEAESKRIEGKKLNAKEKQAKVEQM